MKKFVRSELFIGVWGIAVLVYWPVGVALSVVGLIGGR